jgi:hypothetical protein
MRSVLPFLSWRIALCLCSRASPRPSKPPLLALADDLEKHAATIRRLAGPPKPDPDPLPDGFFLLAGQWNDDGLIDVSMIEADDEASVLR